MDRVYNVEKNRKRKVGDSEDGSDVPSKRGRPKRIISLESRYPSVRQAEGQEVVQVDVAILKEMEKERPRRDVLLSLMKSSFCSRRQCILHNEESVTAKLQKFPALKMPFVVSVYLC